MLGNYGEGQEEGDEGDLTQACHEALLSRRFASVPGRSDPEARSDVLRRRRPVKRIEVPEL